MTAGRNRLRERQWNEAHERYLDCALRVFTESGYHAATVQDIVAQANGSRATFYAHFRDKADIAACLFERALPHGQRIYDRANRFDEVTIPVVRQWLDEDVLEFWNRYGVEVAIVNEAMADDPDVANRHYNWGVAAVRSLHTYLERWSGPHEETALLRALLLVLQLERLCYHWLVRGVPQDRELVLDTLAELWCRELNLLRAGPGGSFYA